MLNASDLIGIFPSQFNNVYTVRWIKIRTIRTYSHIDRCIKFWRESLRTDGRANRQTDRRKDGWITGDHKSSLETFVKLKRN